MSDNNARECWSLRPNVTAYELAYKPHSHSDLLPHSIPRPRPHPHPRLKTCSPMCLGPCCQHCWAWLCPRHQDPVEGHPSSLLDRQRTAGSPVECRPWTHRNDVISGGSSQDARHTASADRAVLEQHKHTKQCHSQGRRCTTPRHRYVRAACLPAILALMPMLLCMLLAAIGLPVGAHCS